MNKTIKLDRLRCNVGGVQSRRQNHHNQMLSPQFTFFNRKYLCVWSWLHPCFRIWDHFKKDGVVLVLSLSKSTQSYTNIYAVSVQCGGLSIGNFIVCMLIQFCLAVILFSRQIPKYSKTTF